MRKVPSLPQGREQRADARAGTGTLGRQALGYNPLLSYPHTHPHWSSSKHLHISCILHTRFTHLNRYTFSH